MCQNWFNQLHPTKHGVIYSGTTNRTYSVYPLVNVYITNWKITIFNG